MARITCRNRKGLRTLLMMVAPAMVPGFPPRVIGITYDFRCEAVTNCQEGTIALQEFVEISLGIDAEDFKWMATTHLGRWDLVQLRCSNFMSCTLEERLALVLLELSEHFGVRNGNGKGISLTVHARHREIAELLGASRPRITEHLIEFEEKHLISREDHRFTVRPYREFPGPGALGGQWQSRQRRRAVACHALPDRIRTIGREYLRSMSDEPA